jgi:hypothetical protein
LKRFEELKSHLKEPRDNHWKVYLKVLLFFLF